MMRIGSLVIDCTDFDGMRAFWQEALHYMPKRPAEGGWVILKDPTGASPNVSLNLKDRPMLRPKGPDWRLSDKIRLHIDFYASDLAAEVQRLLGLGATMVKPAEEGHDYVILADPEGNHFCVVQLPKAEDGLGG